MIQQMPLPLAQDAVSPAISAEAMRFHYDKHFTGHARKPMRAGNYRYRQHMTRPRLGWKPTRRRCWPTICENMPIMSTSGTTGRSSSPTLPQPATIGPSHRT